MGSFSKAFFSIGMIASAVFSAIRGDHVMAVLVLVLREVILLRIDMTKKGGDQ